MKPLCITLSLLAASLVLPRAARAQPTGAPAQAAPTVEGAWSGTAVEDGERPINAIRFDNNLLRFRLIDDGSTFAVRLNLKGDELFGRWMLAASAVPITFRRTGTFIDMPIEGVWTSTVNSEVPKHYKFTIKRVGPAKYTGIAQCKELSNEPMRLNIYTTPDRVVHIECLYQDASCNLTLTAHDTKLTGSWYLNNDDVEITLIRSAPSKKQ